MICFAIVKTPNAECRPKIMVSMSLIQVSRVRDVSNV